MFKGTNRVYCIKNATGDSIIKHILKTTCLFKKRYCGLTPILCSVWLETYFFSFVGHKDDCFVPKDLNRLQKFWDSLPFFMLCKK